MASCILCIFFSRFLFCPGCSGNGACSILRVPNRGAGLSVTGRCGGCHGKCLNGEAGKWHGFRGDRRGRGSGSALVRIIRVQTQHFLWSIWTLMTHASTLEKQQTLPTIGISSTRLSARADQGSTGRAISVLLVPTHFCGICSAVVLSKRRHTAVANNNLAHGQPTTNRPGPPFGHHFTALERDPQVSIPISHCQTATTRPPSSSLDNSLIDADIESSLSLLLPLPLPIQPPLPLPPSRDPSSLPPR